MKDQYTITYKEWLNNLQEPAPEGVWEAVSDQLDIDDAWENIAETLDLDDVWNNVKAELPEGVITYEQPKVSTMPRSFWIVAAFILITLTTPIPESSSLISVSVETTTTSVADTLRRGIPATSQYDSQSSDHGIERSMMPNEENRRKEKPAYPTVHPAGVLNITEADDEISGKNLVDLVNESAALDSAGAPPARSHALVGITSGLDTAAVIMCDSSVTVELFTLSSDSVTIIPRRRKGHWNIGLIGALKNTWLINPETTNGLKRNSLNDTELTFGKDFGIVVERSISERSALQLEYYFSSEIGQRYHEYINALYQSKNIRLHYQKAQLLFRTRVLTKTAVPSFYAIGGVRVSRLTLADASVGGNEDIITQQYRPWDYGFLIGTEAEFKLNDKLILVPGIRASYGLRNIYLGSASNPAEFNKTHTATIGVSLALKHGIKK